MGSLFLQAIFQSYVWMLLTFFLVTTIRTGMTIFGENPMKPPKTRLGYEKHRMSTAKLYSQNELFQAAIARLLGVSRHPGNTGKKSGPLSWRRGAVVSIRCCPAIERALLD